MSLASLKSWVSGSERNKCIHKFFLRRGKGNIWCWTVVEKAIKLGVKMMTVLA